MMKKIKLKKKFRYTVISPNFPTASALIPDAIPNRTFIITGSLSGKTWIE